MNLIIYTSLYVSGYVSLSICCYVDMLLLEKILILGRVPIVNNFVSRSSKIATKEIRNKLYFKTPKYFRQSDIEEYSSELSQLIAHLHDCVLCLQKNGGKPSVQCVKSNIGYQGECAQCPTKFTYIGLE